MNHNNYAVEIIRYHVPADQHEASEKAYDDAKLPLSQSPCFLSYQVIQGTDEPDHYIVIIHWTSAEDHVNKFRKSPEFGSFFTLVKPFFNCIEEMKHYTETNISYSKLQPE